MCEKVMCDDGIERELVTRKEAKEQGLVRYFTGKPCKHGHVAERNTSGGGCLVCARERRPKVGIERLLGESCASDDDGNVLPLIDRKEAKRLGLTKYFTGKPCANGHISERYTSEAKCCKCVSDRSSRYAEENRDKVTKQRAEWYQANKEEVSKKGKIYREENKEAVKERSKKYREKNKDKIREKKKEDYRNNAEYVKERVRLWAKNNKDKVTAYRDRTRDTRNAKRRKKRKEDPKYKFEEYCRGIVSRTLASAGRRKTKRSKEYLGYSAEDMFDHIDSMLLEGMTWENHGDWHIDHIKPISVFIKEGCDDLAVINCLSNLHPMWAEHNMEKRDKTLEEYLDKRPDLIPLYGHLLKE